MIRAVFWLAVVGSGIYIAGGYATPQIRAWRFEDAMSQTARFSETAEDSEMRRALLETAGELHVPLSSSRLQVHRDREGQTLISASWEEIVSLDLWKLGEWVDTLHYAYEIREQSGSRLP
ncbi:hypothetical protein BH20GEM1_BH20GEM1_11580 [soil metagenome]